MNHHSVSPQASPHAGWVVNLLLAICVLTLNFSPALAGTFNVSPVKINLSKNSSTAIITVSNAGNSDTTIQLQTMRWIQDEEGDMRLTFQGRKTETEIKSGSGNLVKGQHTFPKNPFNTRPNINSRESNYDTDRPYTQISVARPPKILSFDKLTKDQEEEFKEKLDSIYKSSIDDIVKEHKNDNNGEDPKSLVVVPIFQDVAKVSSVEINSLVDAIITAQASNPKLKINISAGSDNHKKLIQEAFEKKMSESI
jgi:hypothetical protein